jgi:hypothetical protein
MTCLIAQLHSYRESLVRCPMPTIPDDESGAVTEAAEADLGDARRT